MKKGFVIAEKPSLMRDLREGYEKGKKDGKIDFDLEFSSLVGYLMELQYPEEYHEEWKEWKLETLPMIPEEFKYKKKKRTVATFNEIKKRLMTGDYDFVVNGCDAGREGQSIFWTFYNATGCKLPVKRIWISDQTIPTVIKGFQNLRDEATDDRLINLTHTSFYRMHLDWLIGMNLSRALSLKTNSSISVGRVMTPTLKMVVDRDLEIKNFVPKTTYEVEANFEDKYIGTWFNKETNENRFEDEQKAQKFIDSLGKVGEVTEVLTKRETKWAPPNYSLGDLQRDANDSYGFTAKETLDTAQELYETHKIISYPRTESKALSTELGKELEDHLASLVNVPEIQKEVAMILADTSRIDKVRNSKRYVDDSKLTDHHAIIPTKLKPNLNALSSKEKQLYLLIAKRFISTFLDPYLQDKTTITTEIDNEAFKTVGSVLVDVGYRALYNFKKEDTQIPKVNKGDKFNVKEFKLQEKISTPPPYYNDSLLIGAMLNAGRFIDESEQDLRDSLREVEGLGTVATRDSIIEKLIEKEMLYRKGKSIRATEFGIQIISIIGERKLASPQLTAEWEVKMRQMEDGKYDRAEFEKDMYEYVKEQTADIIENVNTNLGQNNKFETIGKCPICKNDVISAKNFYLCKEYKGKDGDGCSFILPHKMNGANISKANAIKILNGEKTGTLTFTNKDNKKYKKELIFDQDRKQIIFAPGEIIGKCPKCNSDIVDRGNFYGCSGFHEKGCKFGLPKQILKANITAEDASNLLSGELVGPKKFTWESGKKGEAKIRYNVEKGKIEFVFPEVKTIGKCPLCSGEVEDRGQWVQCKDCDFSISKNILKAKLNDQDILDIIEGKETRPLLFTWNSGKKSEAKLKYNIGKKSLEFIFDNSVSVIGKCYYCGEDIIDYKSFIKCKNNKCNFSLSRKISGATITDSDIKKLLDGKESSVKTFTWKNGNQDKKKIKLTKDQKIEFI